MNAKIIKIQKIIDYAGLPCPLAEDVLRRFDNTCGNSDIETINMVEKKYREYILSYRIKNYNTEEKFVKSIDKLINLDVFIFSRKYEQSFPIPQSKLTKSMFGDRDFFELYNNFIKINYQMNLKREEALSKLKEKKA